MALAENIRKYRLKKQLTQPELAEKAGVSKGYVYMLESGEMTNPTFDMLHKIATALEVTIAELIGERKVQAKDEVPEIPKSLAEFANQCRRAGEKLNEDDLVTLARMQFRGQRPETVEDWQYVYEFLKRTLGKKKG